MQPINLKLYFIFALSICATAYSMKITEQNFPPELREPLGFARNNDWAAQRSIEKLSEFFASEAWHERKDKSQVLELFLQNAAIRHEPIILKTLFENGARMNLHKRAEHPDEFEGVYRSEIRGGFIPSASNLFRLVLWAPREIPQSSLESFKLLMKQAIREAVASEARQQCLNTFTLCIFRHNNQAVVQINKDIRRYIRDRAQQYDFAPTSQIIENACQEVCSSLKLLLNKKAGWSNASDRLPLDLIEDSWRSRAKFYDWKFVEQLSRLIDCPLTPTEYELWNLLDPKYVYWTVEQIARECYPDFDITIDDPNSWGIGRLAKRVVGFIGDVE